MPKKIKFKYIITLALILMPFLSANASVLSLKSQRTSYGLGDTFAVDVMLDTQGQCINTVETTVTFNSKVLNFSDFVVGDSIISIWVAAPKKNDFDAINSKGEVTFAGGIPGGYCGKVPGDPGDSNLIARLIFRTPGFYVGNDLPDVLDFKIKDDAQVLMNDGLGTADKVSFNDLSINLNKAQTSSSDREGADFQINQDTIPPEPFVVELYKQNNIYNGKYFIVFSTVDKQTGVDHYEVRESKTEDPDSIPWWEKVRRYIFKPQEPVWKVAATPYLLEDQTLRSVIAVKAIDKAGNERQVEYVPPEPKPVTFYERYMFLGIILGVVLIILMLVVLGVLAVIRRKKSKNII